MLEGHRILVTGALGSLGSAQCELLTRQRPDRLVLLDRPTSATASPDGEARAAALSAATGVRCDFIGHDLGDLAATEDLARTLGTDGIDIVICNAAIIVNRPFEDFSVLEYEEQLRVNAGSVFSLVRGLAPSMKARRGGRVVTFSSLTLNGRWDGYAPYVASKGAVVGLTRSLARELGPFGIRVNAVAPGAVVSDAERRVFGSRLEQYNDWIVENQSLKDRIRPEDVADLVLFLVSDHSRMITGQEFGINGGW
jgi:NAD(P)-dependent dehydrogenase (short-subunit alcohol dehydrogenase family)